MLTDHPPAIYLKRRRLALDYFCQFPPTRIWLNTFFSGPDAATFEKSLGLDCLRCNSTACVAGVLHTMPEYRETMKKSTLHLIALNAYLDIPSGTHLFGPRAAETDGPDASNPAVSDWELGRRRLERLVKEAEAQ